MAYFISHVEPLWSFAAPAGRHRYDGFGHAAASPAPVRDHSIWRWVVGMDGRPERRLASETPH